MLSAEEIRSRIPHDGEMSLIERVVSYDDKEIVCESTTHLSNSNPLQHGGRLTALNLIEYGAQAMAIHGSLIGQSNDSSYLVSVRNVVLRAESIDGSNAPLSVSASLQGRDESVAIYHFDVFQGETEMASGRLTIAYRVKGS